MTIYRITPSTNYNQWQDIIRSLSDDELDDMPSHLDSAVCNATLDEQIRRDLAAENLL